ncbi:cell division transport system permease protein [Litorimonas taeanensis]|uniref:Cell division transport system permease protein n=1 Tax=Litorimonas taeanensis TaxID=568099 RepID=A0A420WD75_9PROT|nr:FtsX-like permease family protein [Litorimonas taeanensis]RKQ68880.1 cell division transport system permease protein [Litorimonas taeanensis]
MTPQTAPLSAQQSILMPGGHNMRTLIGVIAIMAFLAGLALLFSRATLRLSGDWNTQLSRSMTVQVSLSPLAAENNFDTQMRVAADSLRGIIGDKAKISIVDQSASQALIKPWIGNLELPESLTLPGLISIEMAEDGSLPSINRLESQLQQAGIVASIDDHSRWANQIQDTARNFVLSGIALLALLLMAAIGVNLFATRASMAAQRSIISVLAQVGATDSFIAKLFIGQAARRSAIGAGIGLLMLILVWSLLSFSLISEAMFWSSLNPIFADIMWISGLWIAFILFCSLAAGVATKRALIQDRKRA